MGRTGYGGNGKYVESLQFFIMTWVCIGAMLLIVTSV
jgi:hypothetical protein